MRQIELYDLTTLCEDFKVEFKIATDKTSYGLYVCNYSFGPVTWQKPFGERLDWGDYVRIAMRLAAKFPERVP